MNQTYAWDPGKKKRPGLDTTGFLLPSSSKKTITTPIDGLFGWAKVGC